MSIIANGSLKYAQIKSEVLELMEYFHAHKQLARNLEGEMFSLEKAIAKSSNTVADLHNIKQ